MADNDTPETETEGTEASEASEASGPTRRRSRRRNANKPAPPDPSKLKFWQIVPPNTKIDFVGTRKRAAMISLLLIAILFGGDDFEVRTGSFKRAVAIKEMVAQSHVGDHPHTTGGVAFDHRLPQLDGFLKLFDVQPRVARFDQFPRSAVFDQ